MKNTLPKISIFFCLFISGLFFSQSNGGKIIYSQAVSVTNSKTGIGTLYFNKKTSLYSFVNDKKEATSIQRMGNGTTIYPTNTIDSISNKARFVMFDTSDHTFYNNIINNDIEIILKDKTNIKWQIGNESKTILNYKCKKSQGELYGKKYTAWFTDKIPYKYGPVKINGLPGVILELHDDKNELSIIAKEINLGNFDNEIRHFTKKYDFATSISREQYNDVLKKQIKNEEDKINSSLPPGASPVKFGDINCIDCNKN